MEALKKDVISFKLGLMNTKSLENCIYYQFLKRTFIVVANLPLFFLKLDKSDEILWSNIINIKIQA